MEEKNLKENNIRVPWYSKNHPMIPKFYVQPWNQDIKNREIIKHNAKNGKVPTYEHDDTLYLNKREQIKYNMQNRQEVNSRTHFPSRYQMMHPNFHDSKSKYNSGMLARFNDY